MMSFKGLLAASLGLLSLATSQGDARAQAPPPSATIEPKAEQLAAIAAKSDELEKALVSIERGIVPPKSADLVADVRVYLRAARLIVEHGEFYTPAYADWTLEGLGRGLDRAGKLAHRESPWATAEGSTARGYVSRVDGSIQPYAVVVPAGGVPADRKLRLDVVLHGRGATLNEVSFLHAHQGKPAPAGQAGLVLHVFGRGNNAYRWAGETDVFEAIEAVKRNYPVDDRRVVLRGFSMGGAGAWHLGLHHPAAWSSVEAGAGFTETKRYAKLANLTEVEARGIHLYESVDHALNAFNVPMAGYGGEDDPQLKASRNIEEALRTLGFALKADGLVTRGTDIDYLGVVGAKMGHKVDPASAALLAAFHDEHAKDGANLEPARVRFVTYSLKYPKAAWLAVERMGEHYTRATVDARVEGGSVIATTENVAVLSVQRQVGETIKLDGDELPLKLAASGLLPSVYYQKRAKGWEVLDHEASRGLQENLDGTKAPGLQGPIDDAFTGPFLCVRGTGTPWNPALQAWADARLDRFSKDWSKWMRGDLPVKDDAQVTEADIAGKNLILFGDPGSNSLIARSLSGLPLTWTRESLRLRNTYDAATHSPALIAPSPLARGRYVVLNSGHTFGASAFKGTNALLYPQLGDYAVFELADPNQKAKVAGFFDERWRLP
ncbi:alpha/beta hydrolase-fold protein [Isosphaeraceae bacterium EP7]